MTPPTITVVTMWLNARVTLEETLESVRSQTYPHVEHVVIDGGSTDGTVELLEARPGSDPSRSPTGVWPMR